MVSFCNSEDVNDILGKPNTEGVDGESVIGLNSIIKTERVERLISKISDMMNKWRGTNFQYTSYTEHHDGNGLRTLKFDHYPISSITSIREYQAGSTWTTLSNGRNQDVDDYCLDSADAGIVRFWYRPGIGTKNLEVIYVAGDYDDALGDINLVPGCVRHVCALSTAIVCANSKQFLEENKDQIFKWKEQIYRWTKERDEYLDDFNMKRQRRDAFIMGKESSYTFEEELRTVML